MMQNSTRNPEENSDSYYSAGTAAAMDGLELLLKTDPNSMPSVLCVNIGTLVRNALAYLGELKPSMLEHHIQNEIAAIAMDTKGMMRFAGIANPVVHFYWHGWKKAIPEQLQRPESKTRSNVNNNVIILLNRQYDLLDKIGDDIPTISISITKHQVGKLPHKEILRDLSSYLGKRKVMMISHYALDYHAINKGNLSLRLLESYTGHIGGKERINFKLFNNESIPFCGIIHQLLGDPDQLKSPIKRSEMKLIKDTAINDKWSQFPTSDIVSKLKKMGFVRYIDID